MKRALLIPVIIVAVAVVARTNPRAAAQSALARQVANAPDGTVGLSFPARPEVCGDGRTFIGEKFADERQFNIYTAQGVNFGDWGDGDVRARCIHGPVRVILELQRGRVVDVRPYVAPTRAIPARTELGDVSANEAADYLLSVARTNPEIASDAILSAAIGAGTRITPTLMDYARDNALDVDVRESALKWVGRAAGREGTTERATEVTREIMVSAETHTALRERAIRILGEIPGGDRIVRSSFDRLENTTLKERAVRVAAEVGGQTNATWVQGIAFDDRQSIEVRERAVRVLGEELGDVKQLRDLYGRVQHEVLKERIVRTAGEHGSAEDMAWLRQLVLDPAEGETVRDRALRIIAENGHATSLRDLFGKVNSHTLRERIVRLTAESGTREDLLWIEQLVTGANVESALRDRAVRSLADAGATSARLADIFDRSEDIGVRERIVRLLGDRSDETALAKLRAIVRSDRDSDVRERAVRILAEKR